MLVIRPVRSDDLDALVDLTELTSFGLTTLPKDRDLLRKRIKRSLHSFDRLDDTEPHGEGYLFVMEDTETRRVVGTTAVVSKVGGFEPFYAYRIETSVHESRQLEVRKEIPTLHLVAEHNGPCEIGSLFLHPDYRRSGTGRTLSLARFLFMAEYPAVFDPTVIAELRGVIDDQGYSPFWEALGRHFFELDLPRADYLSIVNKQFIGELMPRHPIYIPILPRDAQDVIGQVHQETRPALKLLQSEGFDITGMVDIFEAGPVISCQGDQIRAVRESRRATVDALTDEPPGEPAHIVASVRTDFRACQAAVETVDAERVRLDRATAEALGVSPGDPVRHVALRLGDRDRSSPPS